MKEIEATKYLIKRLKIGYGANCPESDLNEMVYELRDGHGLPEIIIDPARCASCRAKETILFLTQHLELLKE